MDPSHLQDLIQHYGYLAVFVGTLLEGETVLIMAGFAAHRGYLDFEWVVALAAVGGFAGDQVFFMIGRARGERVLARFPAIEAQSIRVRQLVNRYPSWLIVGVRFMYGLRIAGPVLLGMSDVSYWRFAAFNLLGALIWASLFGGAGYLFGNAMEVWLADATRYEGIVLALILLGGVGVWLFRRNRKAPAERRET